VAGYVSEAVIKRLPGYYRHLRELEAAGVIQISSQELGKRMHLTASQIRQDINCFGGFGRQGYGYSVSELKGHIGEIMGIDKRHSMVIIGAGNIGSAVARYPSFVKEGFETVAIFDKDPDKTDMQVAQLRVRHITKLDEYILSNPVDIAVLAVPVQNAQHMLDRVAALGIKAVWNFAPTDLKPPRGVVIVNVHMSDSLQILSYKMLHDTAGTRP
jgi:redox-sensing transcriptional repressor